MKYESIRCASYMCTNYSTYESKPSAYLLISGTLLKKSCHCLDLVWNQCMKISKNERG